MKTIALRTLRHLAHPRILMLLLCGFLFATRASGVGNAADTALEDRREKLKLWLRTEFSGPRMSTEQLLESVNEAFKQPRVPLAPGVLIFPATDHEKRILPFGTAIGITAQLSAAFTPTQKMQISPTYTEQVLRS